MGLTNSTRIFKTYSGTILGILNFTTAKYFRQTEKANLRSLFFYLCVSFGKLSALQEQEVKGKVLKSCHCLALIWSSGFH